MRSYPLTVIALAACTRVYAQLPSDSAARPAQAVHSIGQPPQWQPYVGAYGLWTSGSVGSGGGGILAGIYRPILNPITGLLGASAEATLQARGDGPLGGARAMARVPAFGIGAGIDWQYGHGVAPILSFETAIRRGGLLGHGTMLRLDWLPGSRHTITAGVRVPLMQPLAGRTRPTRTSARLPDPPRGAPDDSRFAFADSTRRLLGAIAADAAVIRAYTSLYMDDDARTLMAAAPREANTFEAVARRYDESLVRAFSSVMGQGVAVSTRVATRARESAVTRVILPYNALFGQVKDGCALGGLVADARADFARWLRDSVVLGDDARRGVLAVHGRWLDIVGAQCTQLLREWKDSRLLWLPLQLALAPDEYDSQESVDTLIAHAVGHAFTDRNALRYLRTADLPLEIARSILAARKYHVLWTHDFTGRRDTGSLDDIAYTTVADAYLPALTAAAARYDSVGTFPQYVILLDAFYYHARGGALLMSILEHPLNATVRLGRGEEAQATHLRQRLSELRSAVARSARLRREAAAHGGDDWLRRVVKVHVNVTQPSDFSFRSAHIIPPIPFTPDNVMRDHRKLALYDFTEGAPYDGALLVTGIGIGEHYSSSTWEDRGYEIRGPAALEARAATRRTLMANGVSEDRIPSMLVETTIPAAADGALFDPGAARAYVGHALQVHNEIGFGPKRSSVARAMLYTLAAPGTVIVVPDPLWMSESWAAMLAAAAARGCHVMIIAPGLANAPSPEPPLITLENAMLQHLLALRSQLREQIAASGGSLRIGIYASRAPASDISGRYSEIRAGLTRAPWIRDLIPFDAQTLDQLNQVLAQTEEAEREATTIARDEKPRVPQLHQKTVLVARRSAIAALVRQPGWVALLARAMRGQATRSVRLADALGGPPAAVDTSVGQSLDTLFRRYEQSLTPVERKRVSFYFSVGSQNHDPRGIMLDGEASVIVAGVQGSAGLVDLFYLMARTTWVDSTSEVDRLVPRPRGLLARIARLIRFTM